MSSSKYQYALDDSVGQNPFRDRAYEFSPIPPFVEVKADLPVPIVPDRPLWEEMYWRAWEVAWSHLRRPSAESSFVANFIEPAFNDHLFMWNSAFMMQFGLYGRHRFNFMGTLDNFYAKQHDDGFICREIDAQSGRDFFYPFDPNGTGPNILAWAEWRYFRVTGDNGRLAQIFHPLLAYHNWCRRHRTWPSGLYWATGLSSGMDNQPRVPNSRLHHRHWAWADATIQAALNCHILSQMATQLGETDISLALNEERSTLVQIINTQLWNSDTKFYQDIGINGRFSPVKSIGAYWALLDKGIIPKKNLADFVQPLRENWAFKLDHCIPSQSADSDGYNQAGNYWRGGVWANTNYMVLKGLRNIGQPALAHEIAINHITNVANVYQRTDTFWEYYRPESTKPGKKAKPDFVGITGLTPIAILLEDIIGVSVDWPQRRVLWDRRLDTPNEYGVRNYPLGSEGTLDLIGDAKKATVITDVPFTLTIQLNGENVQAAVSKGTTEIDLS